jgi:S-DNA-T family DNA segregation ATPase FtsK/SpoIIIE
MPTGTSDFVRRRVAELAGLALVVVALALGASFATYHRADPSFNNATDAQPLNLLGRPGAVLADLLLQVFGAAALILVLVAGAWGWHLMRHRPVGRWWLRAAAAPLAMLLAAGTLASLGPADWPVAAGPGGTGGWMLLDALATLSGIRAAYVAVALLLAALALLCFAVAFGLKDVRGFSQGVRRGADVVRRAGARLHAVRESADTGAQDRTERAAEARRERLRPELAEEEEDAAALADELDVTTAEPSEDAPKTPRSKPRVDARPARTTQSKRAELAAQGNLDLGLGDGYDLPPLGLLDLPDEAQRELAFNERALEQNARLLETVLQDFGIKGEIAKIRPGPVVTLYELAPAPGTKTSRVVGLADDIARSMSAVSARIATIPGRSVIGIELPNSRRETVYLRELLGSSAFERAGGRLPLVLGKDIGGTPVIVDLARMPHLLIAGTTGSGKSVALNAMILSLLYRLPPDHCKFILIDPKMLELSVYDDIPHLLAPVVTEPKKAVVALKWTVREMEDRYRAMSQLGVRNIDGYNARLEEAQRAGEVLTRRVQTGFDPDTGNPLYEDQALDLTPLPTIVVVVDEMADLMLVAGKEIEAAVQRLAQMARAAGIHLIMATQRPSVDVITGTIKANFPTRISFHVTSKIDSRTILGEPGAEQLLGQGDMLYMAHGGRIARVHGPFVNDREVELVVAHLKQQGEPSYIESVTEEDEPGFGAIPEGEAGGDELYNQAVDLVRREGKASTSFVQRHLQIGYNRAARIIEAMERDGIVSEADHVGRREVLLGGKEER